jgi:hypothetical protein
MNKIESIQKDINKLEKALNLIQKTDNHILFYKSQIMSEIIRNIYLLQDKQESIKKLLETK